jgi:hypothetical protein
MTKSRSAAKAAHINAGIAAPEMGPGYRNGMTIEPTSRLACRNPPMPTRRRFPHQAERKQSASSRRGDIELLITDQAMPGMTGSQLHAFAASGLIFPS